MFLVFFWYDREEKHKRKFPTVIIEQRWKRRSLWIGNAVHQTPVNNYNDKTQAYLYKHHDRSHMDCTNHPKPNRSISDRMRRMSPNQHYCSQGVRDGRNCENDAVQTGNLPVRTRRYPAHNDHPAIRRGRDKLDHLAIQHIVRHVNTRSVFYSALQRMRRKYDSDERLRNSNWARDADDEVWQWYVEVPIEQRDIQHRKIDLNVWVKKRKGRRRRKLVLYPNYDELVHNAIQTRQQGKRNDRQPDRNSLDSGQRWVRTTVDSWKKSERC